MSNVWSRKWNNPLRNLFCNKLITKWPHKLPNETYLVIWSVKPFLVQLQPLVMSQCIQCHFTWAHSWCSTVNHQLLQTVLTSSALVNGISPWNSPLSLSSSYITCNPGDVWVCWPLRSVTCKSGRVQYQLFHYKKIRCSCSWFHHTSCWTLQFLPFSSGYLWQPRKASLLFILWNVTQIPLRLITLVKHFLVLLHQ